MSYFEASKKVKNLNELMKIVSKMILAFKLLNTKKWSIYSKV